MQTYNNVQFKIRINNQIRAIQVQLIDADGANLGTMDTRAALKLAQDQALDLIEINPKTLPPIAKIGDFGKIQYEEAKKLKEAKKKQKSSEQKTMEMRSTTEINDLTHKMDKVKEFLSNGSKVKLIVKFKGRELSHRELGVEKLEQCLQMLTGLISSSTQITMDNRDMSTVVSPLKS